MKQGNNLTVDTHLLIQTYLIIAMVYVLIDFGLSQVPHWLDRRLGRRRVVGTDGAAGTGGGTRVAVSAEAQGDTSISIGQLY